jgi:phage shock protein PspC (stress-responsive transcriptional regulator)
VGCSSATAESHERLQSVCNLLQSVFVEKKLYRSTDNKMIAGVCGGLAEYFGIDAVIVRIIAVALLLPGGFPGFLPYVILWIIIPKKGSEQNG